jgi:hypothetical protein
MNFNEAINDVHACLTGRHDRNITRAVHSGMDDMLISMAASVYADEMRDTATALMYKASVVEGTETPYRPDKGIPKNNI